MPEPLPNPLFPLHEAANAEWQTYDQLEIVSTFGEPQAEYSAIRKSAGLMDQPYRAFLELTGKDRHVFLHNLLTNQTWDKAGKTGMPSWTGVYSYFLNLPGRVVADMNVLELDGKTLLEMDARLVAPIQAVFDKFLFMEQVKMRSLVGIAHQIALYGPGAAGILGISELRPLESREVRLCDVNVTIWRDDPAGVPGYHVVIPSDHAGRIWMTLLGQFGESTDLGKRPLRPVGWAAFNTARIEAGRPVFGVDFELAPPASALPGRQQREAETDEQASQGVLPAETGMLDRGVSFTKGCYLGQEVVARMHARGQVARRLVGLRLDSDHLPMAGEKVLDLAGKPVGVVTSSSISPMLSGNAICLAMLKKTSFEVGTTIQVAAEGAIRTARVVELPFVVGAGNTINS